MRTTQRALLIAVLGFGGCYAEGEATYGTGGVYYAQTQPTLVEAEPGIQVVADFPEPVFFVDGIYYRQVNGVWLTTTDFHRGWAKARGGVPARISRIERPERFRHFKGTRTREARRRD
jgi:hypothetical protein